MPKIKHRQTNTPTWVSWSSMVARYKWRPEYTERGIHEAWMGDNGYLTFLSDMGKRPEGHSIERIDNNKGYYPDNCRWATIKEQENNRSNNNKIEYQGQIKTITQWAEEYGMSHQTLRYRLNKLGMTMEEALASPKLYGYNTRK